MTQGVSMVSARSERLFSKGTIGGLLLSVSLMVSSLWSEGARAEGFRCLSERKDIAVSVFHEVQPKRGTRNVAVLVVHDPSAPRGQRTLLRFQRSVGTLENQSAFYEAEVTPAAFVETSATDEILGVSRAALATVHLGVQFTYGMPLKKDAETRGYLVLLLKDGSEVERRMECRRYLKH
jgi:hypothetical protein